jgi:CMP-N-acetylneuraminic acid synthetase
MEVLALVTARGGSKGIPGKNLVQFLGRPLIAWSISAAQEAKTVTRIVATTDDQDIAAVAKEWGAEIPFLRPAELAQDDTPDLPVFVHALNWLSETEDYHPDLVVHLRPTTPLRPAGLIDEAVESLAASENADAIRSVCVPPNNPFKMWRTDASAFMRPLFDSGIEEAYNQPRQKLPVHYWQTGMIDVTRPATILEQGSMTGRNILPLIIEAKMAVDIDDELSLAYAETVCRQYGLGNS